MSTALAPPSAFAGSDTNDLSCLVCLLPCLSGLTCNACPRAYHSSCLVDPSPAHDDHSAPWLCPLCLPRPDLIDVHQPSSTSSKLQQFRRLNALADTFGDTTNTASPSCSQWFEFSSSSPSPRTPLNDQILLLAIGAASHSSLNRIGYARLPANAGAHWGDLLFDELGKLGLRLRYRGKKLAGMLGEETVGVKNPAKQSEYLKRVFEGGLSWALRLEGTVRTWEGELKELEGRIAELEALEAELF